jgi:hypothetical protein
MAKFDFNTFKMASISDRSKFDYLLTETSRIEKLLENLNFREIMEKYKLFARDKQSMMVETLNEL